MDIEEARDRELERAIELHEQGDPGAMDVIRTIERQRTDDWFDIVGRAPELSDLPIGTRVVWTGFPTLHERRLVAPLTDLREGPHRPSVGP
jgi:hypothetical protein